MLSFYYFIIIFSYFPAQATTKHFSHAGQGRNEGGGPNKTMMKKNSTYINTHTVNERTKKYFTSVNFNSRAKQSYSGEALYSVYYYIRM